MNKILQLGATALRYLPFPAFLLTLPISDTAKHVYMLMYNRALLSAKNGWHTDGCVYIIYTLEEMTRDLGKSVTTIKSAYAELRKAGLLLTKPASGTDKAKHAAKIHYLLVPDGAAIGNPAVPQAENRPHTRRISGRSGGGNPPLSNMQEASPTRNVDEGADRIPYGPYHNIMLSQADYDTLAAELPGRLDHLIKALSCHCAANDRTYADYAAALRGWALREWPRPKQPQPSIPDYNQFEEECL